MRLPVITVGLVAVMAAAPPLDAQPAVSRDTTVSGVTRNDAARALVERAIRRMKASLSALPQVRYQAFVTLSAHDLDLPAGSVGSVLFLGETHASAYWAPPETFQETMDARRSLQDQSLARRLPLIEDMSLVWSDHIQLTLGSDVMRLRRMDRGRAMRGHGQDEVRSTLTSPIAPDALDVYDYAVIDTVVVDGRQIVRVAVRPRVGSLVSGTVEIEDSTYAVVDVQLDVVDPDRFPSESDLHYEQRWRDVGEGRWLPYETRWSGELHMRLSTHRLPQAVAGFALPRFPAVVAFEQTATLGGFAFDAGARPENLTEHRAVLRELSDPDDASIWTDSVAPRFTAPERAAWARADSAERHPALLPRIARDVDAAQRVALGPESFHANEVDGLYLGVDHDWSTESGLTFPTRLGYGLGSGRWQYNTGAEWAPPAGRLAWVEASYSDRTAGWQSLVPQDGNPLAAALGQRGSNNFYRERGLTLSVAGRLTSFSRLELAYEDVVQSTEATLPQLNSRIGQLGLVQNAPIQDGRLRTVSAGLTYDSRPSLWNRGLSFPLEAGSWTRLTLRAEATGPGLLASDFSFDRLSLQLERQEAWALGSTTVDLVAGLASSGAPPQRSFTLGSGLRLPFADGMGFETLGRTPYAGKRATMLFLRHDLGRRLFHGTGLPLLSHIPATLVLHAGAFEVERALETVTGLTFATAPTPYTEAGFTLGHLTPFLSPLDLSVSCVWQLSSYPTHGFRIGFGVDGP